MDKNRKKHRIVIIIVASGLASAALLLFAMYQLAYWFGSGGYWRMKSAPKRHQFERLLEEKYGEEFVCLSTSSSGGKFTGLALMDTAKCAPARDKTLVFSALKFDSDDSLFSDTYAENMVEQQLKEMMLPEISGMWESFAMDCDLRDSLSLYENEDVVNKICEGECDLRFLLDEIKKYKLSNDYGDTIFVTFTVCVDDSTRNLSYEEEWEGFHKAAENFCALLSDYNVEVDYELFFSSGDRYESCAKTVENHRYCGAAEGWDSLEWKLEREGNEWAYRREIRLDTTHKAETPPQRIYPRWFDTVEDYAAFRAEMKTENQ